MEDLRHARQHTGRDEGDMLAHHSIQCDLDEVDAFVSHAWDDDFEQRYVALRAWATQFEMEHGRTPIIWLGALTPGSHTSRPPPQLSSMIARKQCSTRARASATRHTHSPSCVRACLLLQIRLALTNSQSKSLSSACPSSSRTVKASLFWAGLLGRPGCGGMRLLRPFNIAALALSGSRHLSSRCMAQRNRAIHLYAGRRQHQRHRVLATPKKTALLEPLV